MHSRHADYRVHTQLCTHPIEGNTAGSLTCCVWASGWYWDGPPPRAQIKRRRQRAHQVPSGERRPRAPAPRPSQLLAFGPLRQPHFVVIIPSVPAASLRVQRPPDHHPNNEQPPGQGRLKGSGESSVDPGIAAAAAVSGRAALGTSVYLRAFAARRPSASRAVLGQSGARQPAFGRRWGRCRDLVPACSARTAQSVARAPPAI